jgi:polynucleotide 5'-hydroxyl-kinase GRC3/NOL9
MPETAIDIPAEWEKAGLERVSGLFMIIGAPDTGKSTFAGYLYERLCRAQSRAAYLDGDPGQSRLGPPTCMTLALSQPGAASFPPRGAAWRKFVGSNSPSGHMLPVLVGAKRLVEVGLRAGYPSIVYDTTGLVDPASGGLALKYAKIDLLQPEVVIAFQRNSELEGLLRSLRRSGRGRIVTLQPSPAVASRESAARQLYRQQAYRGYFEKAKPVVVDWQRYAILPAPRFALHRLVSLEDNQGFSLGLAILLDIDRVNHRLELLTPITNLGRVCTLYLGDLMVLPETFKDQYFS